MHRCRKSCWKYCRKKLKKCRYNYPRPHNTENEIKAIAFTEKDFKTNKSKLRYYPQRNNANVNPSAKSSLINAAIRGNHDISLIDDDAALRAYVLKYVSKGDKAEFKDLKKMVSKQISQHIQKLPEGENDITLKKKLMVVSSVFLVGEQIGSVTAVWTLGNLPFVKSSLTALNVNTEQFLNRTIITDEEELQNKSETDNAYTVSFSNTQGKRTAFEKLVIVQLDKYEEIQIDFYSFLTFYNPKSANENQEKNQKYADVPKLTIDENGKVYNNESPILTPFVIGKIFYSVRRKPTCIAVCPYHPINEKDPKSAYSILLLHSKFDKDGVANLLGDCTNPVDRLQQV